MAIKGKSVIELYNPNTRIKQRYEDENIVTNAFKYLFGQNICAGANQTFMSNFLPLYKNGIGGIILFDSQIEENPNIVVAPNTVGCTGYASTDAYSGSDLSRGGMNKNETSLIDNGMKFVWDFATSQANGDIACVSLTHAKGGKVGYGSNTFPSGDGILLSGLIVGTGYFSQGNYTGYCIVNDIMYIATITSLNTLRLRKYKLYSQDINLKNYYGSPKLIEEKSVTVTSAVAMNALYLKADRNNVYVIYDYNRIIDITDFENIKEYAFPVRAFSVDYIAVREGVAYIATERKKIESYSLADASAKLNEISTNYETQFVSNINGYIVLGIEMLDKNDNIRFVNKSASASDYHLSLPGFCENEIIVPYTYMDSSGRYYARYSVISNYLATINNLKVPITKTSAQTMKITYTLTEE